MTLQNFVPFYIWLHIKVLSRNLYNLLSKVWRNLWMTRCCNPIFVPGCSSKVDGKTGWNFFHEVASQAKPDWSDPGKAREDQGNPSWSFGSGSDFRNTCPGYQALHSKIWHANSETVKHLSLKINFWSKLWKFTLGLDWSYSQNSFNTVGCEVVIKSLLFDSLKWQFRLYSYFAPNL